MGGASGPYGMEGGGGEGGFEGSRTWLPSTPPNANKSRSADTCRIIQRRSGCFGLGLPGPPWNLPVTDWQRLGRLTRVCAQRASGLAGAGALSPVKLIAVFFRRRSHTAGMCRGAPRLLSPRSVRGAIEAKCWAVLAPRSGTEGAAGAVCATSPVLYHNKYY